MANIKSIGGNPIVLDASGIAAGAVTPDKLADMGGITAGAANGITGEATDSAAWLQRVSTSDGPTTIRSIHGNTIVQDGVLVSVNMTGIESTAADESWTQQRLIPAGTLRSAGTVYDEQTETERITRVGVVDLGTLTWTYASSGDIMYANVSSLGLEKDSRNITLPIDSTNAYTTADGTYLRIIGSGYTDAAAFKTAMNGKHANAALATPTTTPIDPPLNMTYRTGQGGTERIMVPTGENSAPPTIVAAQGYTAESLRDAALSAIAPIENGLASTNYGVGSYLVHGGQLCKVTTAIATGESITIGTNVTATTVMAEVIALIAQ